MNWLRGIDGHSLAAVLILAIGGLIALAIERGRK